MSKILTEKVSKQQFDLAINSPDIIIGAEFEFISNAVAGQSGPIKAAYNKALKDFNAWKVEATTAKKKRIALSKDIAKVAKLMELAKQDGDSKKLEKLKIEFERIKAEIKSTKPKEMGPNYFHYVQELTQTPKEEYQKIEQTSEVTYLSPLNPEQISLDYDLNKSAELFNDLKSFPMPLFKIGSEKATATVKSEPYWIFAKDVSILEGEFGGIELKSPPMPLKEFVETVPTILKWINSVGYTDHTCGMHVNISLKGVQNLFDKMNPIKLLVMMDEGYVYQYFAEREFSQHAIPVELLKDQMSIADIEAFLKDDRIGMIKWLRTPRPGAESLVRAGIEAYRDAHQNAINFLNYLGNNENTGRVEIRYIGGDDYSKKWNEIYKILG